MTAKKKSNAKRNWYIFLAVLGLSVLGAATCAFYMFKSPNVRVRNEKESFVYVPTGATFAQLNQRLDSSHVLMNAWTFKWVAERLDLQNNMHPGRYKIENGMSNWALVRLLRSGRQTPVRLVFIKFRLKSDLAGAVGRKMEFDSTALLNALNDDTYMKRYGMKSEEALALFVPNTYEFYWNTPLDNFMDKMYASYQQFWNPQRVGKAKHHNLSVVQLVTLASIVEEETNVDSDKPLVASVYFNRLKAGIPLQADPTVKFALHNFSLRRVWGNYLQYDSPYNTYKYMGLPPGPICTPSVNTLDAVLNAADTPYYYFCADPDRIGYSVFAKNLQEHERNRQRYQLYLNRRGIR